MADVEGQDFTVDKFINSGSRGQATVDYHITLDMAKELSMVERNAKGKQARQYFIHIDGHLSIASPKFLGQYINSTGRRLINMVLWKALITLSIKLWTTSEVAQPSITTSPLT